MTANTYIDPYAAEMRDESYSQQTSEKQIRLVTDFGRWLAKPGIQAQEITAELFQPYLRARKRRRLPTGNDVSALRRLLDLLTRKGVVPAAVPLAATAADRLQSEFRLYLQQERGLASTTQDCYLGFVGEFLTERFGTGPVDLSGLCAADVTGFVRRRAITIQSIRVHLLTTALRSFLRFARARRSGLARGIDYGARESRPLFSTAAASRCLRGHRRLFTARKADSQQ
jgi:hypothetical protein